MLKHTHLFIVFCIALGVEPGTSSPASEGRSLPIGLWVKLPSGPLVPPVVPLLSHLASALGKAPYTRLWGETPYYRRGPLTIGDNPLLYKGPLITERGSFTIITASPIVRDFVHIVKIPSKRFLPGRTLLLQSDKGFFIIPLSKEFFATPNRQNMFYHPSLTGCLYYSSNNWILHRACVLPFVPQCVFP